MSAAILLADDYEANRAALKRRLERRGYSVIEAADGLEALAKFTEHTPDLILMDLSMPQMGGEESLMRIRESNAGKRVPVVALTAHAMDETKAKCALAGFDAFHSKPIEFDDLLEIISQLLSEGRNTPAPQAAP